MNIAIAIVFYVILAVVGIICLWNAYDMKTKGNLKIGWFVGQDIKKEKCKDINGFIEATVKPIIIFGAFDVFAAVTMILLQAFNGSKYIQLLLLLVLIGLFIWLNNVLKKATSEYLK